MTLIQDCIRRTFNCAVVIDDDFSGLSVPAVDDAVVQEIGNERPPEENGADYVREAQPDGDRSLQELRRWLDSFTEAGILPMPIFHDNQDEGRLRKALVLSSFAVIDYQLQGITAIDVIKKYVPRGRIYPVVVISQRARDASADILADEEFRRDDSVGETTCIYRENTGTFLLVYSKRTFAARTAMEHIAQVVDRRFERYSILATEFYERLKTDARTISGSEVDTNLDVALIRHALRNSYQTGDLDALLLNLLRTESAVVDKFDAEQPLLEAIRMRAEELCKGNADRTQAALLQSVRACGLPVPECLQEYMSVGSHWRKIKRILCNIADACTSMDELSRFLTLEVFRNWAGCVLNYHCREYAKEETAKFEVIFSSREFKATAKECSVISGVAEQLKRYTGTVRDLHRIRARRRPPIPQDELARLLQEATIHVLLAKNPSFRDRPDTVAGLIKYELTPHGQNEACERLGGYAGDRSTFHGMRNGELFVRTGDQQDVRIGVHGTVKTTDIVRYCITPACDILRPSKVGGCLKFVRGHRFTGEGIKTLEKLEPNLPESIVRFRYASGGRQYLVRLNLADVESIKLVEANGDPDLVRADWKDWQSVLRLKAPYAHNILNKYLAYQSRSGIEDIDW